VVRGIIKFTEAGASDRALVGGKAASLGRLVEAGFPVPPGFSVSTELYSDFLSQNNLSEQIAARLRGLVYDNAVELEAQTAEIRTLILECPVPVASAEALLAAYHTLGDGVNVAVRSSGTAEDMAEASFAGLHDTYLDIRGDADVVDAVRRCWASLWTARCVSYRQNAGIEHETALIAVVVQRMVNSEVSGVMFTANPLTERTDQVVVNASWGLGEGIVSGILTPDEFIVDTKTLRITDRTLGGKSVEIVRGPDGHGVQTLDVSVERSSRFTLSDAQVVDLVKLGKTVSEYYGGLPQDMEWALAEGKLYLLQSRDVTGADFTWDEDLGT
jgi:pyruvate,water dikinase